LADVTMGLLFPDMVYRYSQTESEQACAADRPTVCGPQM